MCLSYPLLCHLWLQYLSQTRSLDTLWMPLVPWTCITHSSLSSGFWILVFLPYFSHFVPDPPCIHVLSLVYISGRQLIPFSLHIHFKHHLGFFICIIPSDLLIHWFFNYNWYVWEEIWLTYHGAMHPGLDVISPWLRTPYLSSYHTENRECVHSTNTPLPWCHLLDVSRYTWSQCPRLLRPSLTGKSAVIGLFTWHNSSLSIIISSSLSHQLTCNLHHKFKESIAPYYCNYCLSMWFPIIWVW